MLQKTILVVDDEKSIRDALRMILEYEGYGIEEADSGLSAIQQVKTRNIGAIVLDIKMQGMDGIETLEAIKKINPSIPIILLTGHGTIETAVEATKKGAFDFLSKPPDRDKILITLRNAFKQEYLLRENAEMKMQIESDDQIIGASDGIRGVIEIINRVAPTDARVLITGENGTGKELVAKAIHRYSARSDKPFIEVNCAAIPTELIESELFGHEKGAFTGATTQRIGKFELAHHGTIFLDEIGDMSSHTQAKVLRVLEEGTFERVGGSKQITVDVRVISATNKNLPEEIGQGHFREDLLHRLNVIPIHIPALRDRRDDIPVLINHFIAVVCERNKLLRKSFTQEAIDRLRSMNWRGNVRELRNAVERLLIMAPGHEITKKDVETSMMGSANAFNELISMDASFQEFKDQTEKLFIQKQLERYNWNISRTAEELDIQRSHLYTKMKKYGLMREGQTEESSSIERE